MASADDLIRVYERRLAEFEARLAAIERERARPFETDASAPAARRSSSGYRLGVDVGGTFTDLLLLDEKRARAFTAKVPSTPSDSSIGVLNGIEKICREAGIDPTEIDDVMHGTTVATNTVLTKAGARVGLVTTKGFRDVLQIARSYVPGGLGGWVIYNKPPPLAPLELTIEAEERIAANGEVLIPLDEAQTAQRSLRPRPQGHRGADRFAVQRLRRRQARAAHRRDRARDHAEYSRLDLQRRDPGDVRIRAGGDDGRQFLHPPGRVQIRAESGARAVEQDEGRAICTSCAPTAACPPRAPPWTAPSIS